MSAILALTVLIGKDARNMSGHSKLAILSVCPDGAARLNHPLTHVSARVPSACVNLLFFLISRRVTGPNPGPAGKIGQRLLIEQWWENDD